MRFYDLDHVQRIEGRHERTIPILRIWINDRRMVGDDNARAFLACLAEILTVLACGEDAGIILTCHLVIGQALNDNRSFLLINQA